MKKTIMRIRIARALLTEQTVNPTKGQLQLMDARDSNPEMYYRVMYHSKKK
jgi:hypothetical protein